MMRPRTKWIWMLTLAFAFSTLDVPPTLFRTAANPKTCCGRQICDCTHAKGAFCPLRKAREDQKAIQPVQPKPAKKQCPLHVGMELPEEASPPVPVNVTLDDNLPVLKSAPCHPAASRSTLPASAKDFDLDGSIHFTAPELPAALFPNVEISPPEGFARTLDPPPRLLLSI